MQMSRVHSSEDEKMVSQKRTYIICVFTALQQVLAFTVSSSAICLEKAIMGKCPSLQAELTFCLQCEVISCLLYSSVFFISGPKGEMAFCTNLFLSHKPFLQYDSGWLKSVCENRSTVLLGSCTKGLCGQNVMFYSQGLPSVFIAGFSVHSVILCSCFMFLHTLNVAKLQSLLDLYLFSGSVVVKLS